MALGLIYAHPMPYGRAGTYLTIRSAAAVILALHLGIRLVFPNPAIFPDLILFNLAAFLAALAAFRAPAFNDRYVHISLGLGFFLWGVGSTVSTVDTFYAINFVPVLTDFCYSLFYPLVLFGMLRAMTSRRQIKALEIFDTLIIALGVTSMAAGFLLKPAMLRFEGSSLTVFLSILYPVGDIALLAVTLAIFLMAAKSLRTFLILLGVTVFAVTDLVFLVLSASSNYPFGSLTDDGWVLGLILIAEALYYHGGEFEISQRIASLATLLALMMSAIALIIAVTTPNYLPKFILIPSFITIGLAFLRMQFAIKFAEENNLERELSRTDELTGIANRRRFLDELALLLRKEGSLLLLDLDGFKAINDNYGHEAGDQLLKQISLRFSRAIPTDALLARLGGDEFGVIVYGSAEFAMEIAYALRATVTYPFALKVATVEVGVSIGVVANESTSFSQEEILRRADSAMYQAKRNGSGVVTGL